MSGRVLLVEPYEEIADVITGVLEDLNYQIDVVTSGRLTAKDLRNNGYRCVFINLDQNSSGCRNEGLRLAEIASELGVPVVLIPDHATAHATIQKNGWLSLTKPFTVEHLEQVIAAAVKRAE